MKGGFWVLLFGHSFIHKVKVFSTAAFILLRTVSVTAGEAKPSWQAEWDKTVEAAKSEGQVVILGGGRFSDIPQEFQKKYPGIKIIEGAVASGSPARMQILFAERRAKKYRFDIVLGVPAYANMRQLIDNGVVDPITPALMLPEVLDKSRWWGGEHLYWDAESKYFYTFEGNLKAANIAYNTNLVNPKEITSFWDLLNPKWKGKIVAPDVRDPGAAGGHRVILLYHHPDLGPEFIRGLFGKMDITLSRNYIQMNDWLAVGKFAFNIFNRGVTDAKKQGLPVQEFAPTQFKEGGILTAQQGTIGLVNQAPHPNAAKVFINWLLSREGQIVFQRISAADDPTSANSRRMDVPKDVIDPQYRLVPGSRYLEVKPENLDTLPIINLIRQVLQAAGK